MTDTPTYRPRKYLSISTLINFARCPRRHFYSKCGLTTETIAFRPRYGSAMHKAVPIALDTFDIEPSMEAFVSVWAETEALLDAAGDNPPAHNRSAARRSLNHFIHTHKDNQSIYRLLPPPSGLIELEEKVSDWEVPWALDIGLPIPLVGRMDGLCEHLSTGDEYVWEFKTTSRLTSAFFDAHEMAIQNMGYCLAAKTLLDRDVKGVIIEGMQTHKTKVDNMAHPIVVQPHDLEKVLKWLKFYGEMLLHCESLASELENPADAFLQDFSMCTGYTHFYIPGYRCDYHHMCQVEDWRSIAPIYDIVPEHDFLSVSVEGVKVNGS